VAQVGVQVASALEHAHKQGVLHRDVKPSNLLLDLRGTVWVTDFGLAKANDQQDLTNTGDFLGTLRYMPPEAFEGRADARGDVYALGLTLYEMLALRPAFDEKDRNRLIKRVTTEEPARLNRLNRAIPRDLVTIVHKAIDREPGRRYQTAADLAADIQRFMDDEPIKARRVSAWRRAVLWARRRPAAAALLLVSGVAVLALGGVGTGLYYNAQLQEALQQTERQKDKAEEAQREETAQRHVAQAALREAHFHQYFHYLARANAAWRVGSMAGVEKLLDACPTDQRHWEWDYLKRQCHAGLLTLRGHTAQVYSVAFSPDGTGLASASADGTVKLWDAATGQEIRTLRAHLEPGELSRCTSAAFSPDGTRLASASTDGTVKVWDATTGQQTLTLAGHTAFCFSVTFSPDGTRLASSAAGDETVKVWDAATGKELFNLRKHIWGFSVMFSPDGTRLATATADGTVWVWDATTEREALLRIRTGHTGMVRGVAFSPDGTRLATASFDGTVKVWDAATGQEIRTLAGHTGGVSCVAFSPEGTRLASGSLDQTVRIWDATTGKEVGTLKGHTHEVSGVMFSPDGARLASASSDHMVKIWDTTSKPEARTLSGHAYDVFHVAFSPDGKRCASASTDRTVKVWDTRTGRVIHTLASHTTMVTSVAFSPDGKRLASATGAFPGLADAQVKAVEVKVWDVTTGREIHTLLKEHTSGFHSVEFSPDGTRLAAAGIDKTVKLWKVTTGQEVLTLIGHTDAVRSVAFSPDGKRLASGDTDGTAKIWDASTGKEIHTLGRDTSSHYKIRCLALSPDGSRLATAYNDGAARLWDVSTGQLIYTLTGHTNQVLGWAFNADGKRLASASWDGTVKLWDVTTGQEALTLTGHTDAVISVAFSPDGKQLATSGRDGTVKLWDARPWTPEEGTVEREAQSLLSFLFAKPLRQADVLDYLLRHSPTLRSQARQLALSLVDRYREETDPERYQRAAWNVLRQPHLNAFQYRFALRQAETACRLLPGQGLYLTTLGMAHYRAGQYREAAPTLAKANLLHWATPARLALLAGKLPQDLFTLGQAQALRQAIPANLAFLAMAHHQLGEKEKAQATLARLHEVMKAPGLARDDDHHPYVREADALIEGKAPGPKQ
jgi:WD40 repeat protein